MDRPKEPILSTHFVARAARVAIVAWALVGLAAVLYLIIRFVIYPVRVIFPPLLLALILVYLFNPLVSFLERRGIRRGWGTLITYVVVLGGIGVGLVYLIPVVSDQISAFTGTIPRLLNRAQEGILDLAHRLGLHVTSHNLFGTFQPTGGASSFIGRISSLTTGALHVALIVILGPVLAFYLLIDLPKLRQALQAVVPGERRAEVQGLTDKLSTAIGGYFRGQLLVALFVAAASMLALYVVGLPFWAPVGLIAGLFNLVPLIGPFIGAVPAIFIAFTAPDAGSGFLIHPAPGWPLAVAASLALIVVQQIDNLLISPRVVTRTVKLHPLTVMISLLAAGALLGLWGMLLVIPVVASAKILVMHYWDTRMMWPPQEAGTPAVAPPVPVAAQSTPGGDGQEAPTAPADQRPAPPDTERGRQGHTGRWWVRLRLGLSRRRSKAQTPARGGSS